MGEIVMSDQQYEQLVERVQRLRREASELCEQAAGYPAVARNTQRLLACVRMMEISLGVSELPPPPACGV
jgi:hypothetical protein